MWLPPLIQICATPSHPLFPYDALHTSTRPAVGGHVDGLLPLFTVDKLRTSDRFQSDTAALKELPQSPETFSPMLRLRGLLDRAQWYLRQA